MFCLGALAVGQQPPPADVKPDPAKQDAAADSAFSMDLDSLFTTKVTTASKFAEELSGAAAVISVVSKDELRRFGGMTLGEILARVGGLTATTSVLDHSLVAVRGDQTRIDGGHILILINGRPCREVIQGNLMGDLLESFPVNILERIEVIQGPGSVLYGSDAFSGVINLITQKAEGKSYRLSTSGGPSGTSSTSMEMLYQKGDLNIVAAGQYHQLPQWDVHYLGFNPASNSVGVENSTLRDDGPGGYLGVNYKGFSFMSSYTGLETSTFVNSIVGDIRTQREFADLGYAFRAAKKWEMTFDATYTRTLLDAPDLPFVGSTVHRDSYQGLLEWTNFITFSDKDKLTFGTLYNHVQGMETDTIDSQNEIVMRGGRSATGFYVQHEHKLTGDLKVIGGLQANKIGTIALNVVPRVGLLWNPAANFTLKALYGGAFRAPGLDELYLKDPGLLGNPNLVPEKVGTLDLQMSYQSHRLQASIGYFHSRQTHAIILNPSVYPARYVNLDSELTFQGVEAEGKYYVRKNWFFTTSMLYQLNNNGAGVSNPTPIPSLGAKAGASYEAANGAEISLFDAYQGRATGYATALNPLPYAFHSLSLHARYDLSKHLLKDNTSGFALFVHGDDLTNHQVWLPAWGSYAPDTIPVVRGRTLYFGLEVWQKHE
jgi:outer membrane cobalamin receptor